MSKINKLRKSAKGQDCAMQVMGVCNYNNATTILAHVNYNGGAMGGKSHDLSAVYACSECHDFIDSRNHANHPEQEFREWYIGRALVNTHVKMFNDGVIK